MTTLSTIQTELMRLISEYQTIADATCPDTSPVHRRVDILMSTARTLGRTVSVEMRRQAKEKREAEMDAMFYADPPKPKPKPKAKPKPAPRTVHLVVEVVKRPDSS